MSGSDLQKQLHDLQKVLDITRSMAAETDVDALLRLIVECGMELMDAERATIFLYDREQNQLYSRIAAGVEGLRIPADRGIAGATVRTDRVIIVPDAYADERFNPEVDRTTGYRTRSILSVPLHDHEGGLVGVMQVLNKREGTFESYDVTLAETLGAQAGVAIQRANLIEHYLEKQQMERAMRIAREIQQDLLPHSAPSIPGFDVAGDSVPADETGGDTYDFMPLADGRWMITVADASGHGIGPALVIAETRAMLRAVSLGGADLRDTLRTANRLLAADLDGSRFVTCFLGSLDPPASAIHYASAGHGPLLFYDYQTEQFRQVPGTAMPLGVDDGTEYTQLNTVRFEPGDFAIIPTDGYFEAASPSGEQFGIQRLMDLARRCCDISAERMIQNFRKAVLDFSGGKKQTDDMTIVVIRRNR
jgi:sigma-B regulation protein RsbU (phosphoserine phosphatase)